MCRASSVIYDRDLPNARRPTPDAQPHFLTRRPSPIGPTPWLSLLLLAALVTGLNAAKPMRVDDACFYANAVQAARHPADPYGFTAFWDEHPVPGLRILCPPVLPYWWSIGIRLFGPDDVVAWKLWLLPWIVGLTVAVYGLGRRFAPAAALPLAGFVALSPVVLPAVNLMLDVPALAAGLGGLCLAMSAVDRESIGRALAAGVVLGVAMQTKYTAVSLPVAALAYAAIVRPSWRSVAVGAVPGVVAAGVFVAWEGYVAHRYGQSHFMYHLSWVGQTPLRGATALGLLAFVGALAPAVGLLAAAAVGVPAVGAVGAALAVVVVVAAVMPVPVERVAYTAVGVGVWAAVLACGWQLVGPAARGRDRRPSWFLLAWLGVEVVVAIDISPFPAARRYLGTIVVLSLLVARAIADRSAMAAGDARPSPRPRWRPAVVAFWWLNAALGLAYWWADRDAAEAERTAFATAAAVVDDRRSPGQTAWFTGHWGLQFYAERAGFQPLVGGRSTVHKGDWLIMARHGVATQHLLLPRPRPLSVVQQVAPADADPVSTNPYYGSDVPVERRQGPPVWLTVMRATRDFTPDEPPTKP